MLMKKLLLAGLVALVVLLAFPTAVSAADVIVSGTVPISLSIDVINATPDFGTFSIGENILNNPSLVKVTTSSTDWYVDATSNGGGANGYMWNYGKGTQMTAAFNMSKIYPGPTWVQTTTPWVNFMQGTSAGYFSQNVWVQQIVSPIDTSGNYAITVTFTGIPS